MTVSGAQSFSLNDPEAKVVKALVGGHVPTIISSLLDIDSLREVLFGVFTDTISRECGILCRKQPDACFRNIPLSKLAEFSWDTFVAELKDKAPILLHILTAVASFSDHRNQIKVGSHHLPGICSAVAVLLKERNREVDGIQSVVSALMFLGHCEKQV